MKKPINCLPFLLLISFAFGCSDKLTDSKAEKLVKDNTNFPKAEDVPIQYGLVEYDHDSLPGFYYQLQQSGMFRIESLGKGGVFAVSYDFRVTPTEEGKKYIIAEDRHPVKQGGSGEYLYNSRFKVCDLAFDGIEAIQESPEANGAEIKYRVKRQNFTPFWDYYVHLLRRVPDSIQQKTMRAMKTGDGWTHL